jgi:hypothetical protein
MIREPQLSNLCDGRRPTPTHRAGTWRRPQCPGNQHHAHARFQFPPAIHPRESPVCRWLRRKHRSASLGRSHVFGDSTLRHNDASRNRKTFRACAETVDDQTSLWKPEEKYAELENIDGGKEIPEENTRHGRKRASINYCSLSYRAKRRTMPCASGDTAAAGKHQDPWSG